MQGRVIEMRHVREILRLKGDGASDRRIAECVGLARSTVARVAERAARAGLAWPLAPETTDADLATAIFNGRGAASHRGVRRRPEPEWAALHLELKRPNVTLQLLWEEYRTEHPGGYGYSRFCELYRTFERRLGVSMRQSHVAGEKMFVDYAGATVPVTVDTLTGEVRLAQVFVAVLGASSYTYAEATWAQKTGDWIVAQSHALEAFGGAPELSVVDNAKALIAKALIHEPAVQRTYAEFAGHYGMAVLNARVRRPPDKAKVEVAVQIVQRWVLARLRNRRFTSLGELNGAIFELTAVLNARPMRKLGTSRLELFERVEKSALRPLPAEPYVFAEWKVRRVGLDYHVDIDGHYYSVPHRFAREQVEARVAARTVEIFHTGRRIAAHMREGGRGKHTTQNDHMPEAHRAYAGWTLESVRRQAEAIGPSTGLLVRLIIEAKRHPMLGLRATLGVVRLARPFGRERLEAACARGLDIGARSYGSIRSILDHDLDRQPRAKAAEPAGEPIVHANLRGPRYYH